MSAKITVLQLLPSLQTGGVERGTIEISQALCDAGHRSIVMSAGGRMVSELEAMGAEHVQWDIGKKSLSSLQYIYRLRCYLKNNHVDILHARSRLPAWIAYLAWKGMDSNTRPHFVTTVHGLYSVKKYSAIMTRGEKVIAVSDTVKHYILDNYPDVDEKKIQVIYRGVEPNEFRYGFKSSPEWLNKWYESYPQLKGKKVITLPGRLTRLKGHHDFIDLISQLNAQGHDIHGLIVGGEDPRRKQYADGLHDKIASMNIKNMITFTGLRKDIREIYAVSNIVLSLSEKPESFGRTTLEALSIGVPVIGYDHGGVAEILSKLFPHGRVVKGDVVALAKKVINIIEYGVMVNQQHEFTLAVMTSKTLLLYQNLVGNSRK